jgi:hypothetical protein
MSRLCACAGTPPPLQRAPAWLRRPAAACFGFGGKLASVRRPEGGGEGGQLSIRQVRQIRHNLGSWLRDEVHQWLLCCEGAETAAPHRAGHLRS